jgi:raffinose/stachyose/melibiose transport system substrate-binding protein
MLVTNPSRNFGGIKMKRLISLIACAAMLASMAGCASSNTSGGKATTAPSTAAPSAAASESAGTEASTATATPAEATKAASVTLTTFSTYAGSDGNAQSYQDALAAWQAQTGNKIDDTSVTADESVKARVRTDFSTGSEPDVLFYFTGADADSFLDKVISVDDIRAQYPDYATNMNEASVPKATDGKWYAVPVNGYWEDFFVNKTVLDKAGVSVPGKDYTWDQFLSDCQKIKDAGFTPIAASFVDVPHYWWEFTIFDNNTPATQDIIPKSIDDSAAKAWIAGMNDIKQVYDLGYFPENCLSEKDEALQELLYTDEAGFLLDGSWRAGTIKTKCADADGNVDATKLANYTICNFPSKNDGRKSTDMIGGMSEGWYISQKAWNDPAKRDAAVNFVTYMTSDAIVSKFTGAGSSALKNGVQLDSTTLDSLDQDIIKTINEATSFTPAVQDAVAGDARNTMFQAIPQMLAGNITPEDLVGQFITDFAAEATTTTAAAN